VVGTEPKAGKRPVQRRISLDVFRPDPGLVAGYIEHSQETRSGDAIRHLLENPGLHDEKLPLKRFSVDGVVCRGGGRQYLEYQRPGNLCRSFSRVSGKPADKAIRRNPAPFDYFIIPTEDLVDIRLQSFAREGFQQVAVDSLESCSFGSRGRTARVIARRHSPPRLKDSGSGVKTVVFKLMTGARPAVLLRLPHRFVKLTLPKFLRADQKWALERIENVDVALPLSAGEDVSDFAKRTIQINRNPELAAPSPKRHDAESLRLPLFQKQLRARASRPDDANHCG
jgi:hypothetical protein